MKKKSLIFTGLFCLLFLILACPEENKPKPKEKNSDGGIANDDNEIKINDDNDSDSDTKSSTGTLDDQDVIKKQDDNDRVIDDNEIIFKTDGKIGSSCKSTEDCLISKNAQMQSLCLDDTVKEQSIGFHAGYCTTVGCDYFAAVGQMSPTSANTCPDGSACSQLLANSESEDPIKDFNICV